MENPFQKSQFRDIQNATSKANLKENSTPESKYFNKNLTNYPKKFITGFGVPNDKDFSQKFELIESIENGILNIQLNNQLNELVA